VFYHTIRFYNKTITVISLYWKLYHTVLIAIIASKISIVVLFHKLILLLLGKRADSKADYAQRKTKYYNCSMIKSEKVLKLFSSIYDVGSEFHSRMEIHGGFLQVQHYWWVNICCKILNLGPWKLWMRNWSHHLPATKSTPFMVSKDEWNAKEGPGKSMNNALYV